MFVEAGSQINLKKDVDYHYGLYSLPVGRSQNNTITTILDIEQTNSIDPTDAYFTNAAIRHSELKKTPILDNTKKPLTKRPYMKREKKNKKKIQNGSQKLFFFFY